MDTEWCGWNGSVASFMATPDLDILGSLTRFLRERGAPQLFAWDRSLGALKEAFSQSLPQARDCELVLEYELPLSGGRRPDLIFLNNGTALVIEFKNRVEPEAADLDQVLAYVRELNDYHEASRGKTLVPVLVPIGFQDAERVERGVHITGTRGLARLIREAAAHTRAVPPDSAAWVRSRYEPLPALADAARLIFEHKPLPQIRTAAAGNIPAVVARVEAIAEASLKSSRKSLVLITGVPGAGKTLVGLQCAYSSQTKMPAVFLSGNGPLVSVLQYQLDSSVFVRGLKPYLRECLIRRKEAPRERLVVFDEAQRAWDRDRVLEKHAGELADSEPALLLQVGNLCPEGFTALALMGEGQEIHAGEESGIENWVDAVARSGSWTVHGPAHLCPAFAARDLHYEVEPFFHLTSSLRSHRALDLAQWTNALLAGDLAAARKLAEGLRDAGYT
ncbi:MAG: DNA/RNA helicase domain-containing protein, partial [bacterium]